MDELIQKIQENLDGATILIGSGLNKQAAPLLWNAVRSSIFFHLKEKEESFSSTKEALTKILFRNKDDNALCDNIIFLETVALLSEWDEYFCISDSQIKNYKNICTGTINKFIPSCLLSNKQMHYIYFEDEINRHLMDSEVTKSTQYEAATRNEKLYTCWLRWGFVITITGISTFLYTLLRKMPNCMILLGQFVALLGAGITLWPLIKNYSLKAEAHRRFAEKYNELSKKCKNWRTDFPPDGKNITEAKMYVISIRESMNSINSLTPATLEKDFLKGKESRDSGAYDYSTNKNKKNNSSGND